MRTVPIALALTAACAGAQSSATSVSCAPNNAGLTLPAGFCATLFADSLEAPRHMTVAPNGDVIVALRGARRDNQTIPGGVVVLRDTNNDGRADRRNRFGEFSATEVQLVGNSLYTENGTAILRYRWNTGAMSPAGPPDTIVSGLPGMGHSAKTFVVHGNDLFVNHGSRTNSCQERDRMAESPGVDPCVELETRAGIWRYAANRTGQTIANGERYATGIRNAVAMDVDRTGQLYVVQHGRDQLAQNWPRLFTEAKNAETPAEELFRVTSGADFGWPYCYYDLELRRKVLAPEYGGDGKTVGRCANKQGNVGTFPAHWAPNGLLFYRGAALPQRYSNGAFIVFHGSWNRAPLPQAGFNVVFQPMAQGRAQGDFEMFVDGFISPNGQPTAIGGRPTGIAQGPNGELYVSDDSRGRIWRINYTGPR